MNAFKNVLSTHPGNQLKASWESSISNPGSSLYQMASVSSPTLQVSTDSFQKPMMHSSADKFRIETPDQGVKTNFGAKQSVKMIPKAQPHTGGCGTATYKY